jgi:hypothetical protein
MTESEIETVATTNAAQIIGLHVLNLGGKAQAIMVDGVITLRIVAHSVAAAQVLYSKACKHAGLERNATRNYQVRLFKTDTVITVEHLYCEGYAMPVIA